MAAGRVISRTTVQRVTHLEQQTDEVKQLCHDYDLRIKDLLDDTNFQIHHEDGQILQDWDTLDIEHDPDFLDEFSQPISDDQIPEQDQSQEDFTPDTVNDPYLHMEVSLPRGPAQEAQFATVTKRLKD